MQGSYRGICFRSGGISDDLAVPASAVFAADVRKECPYVLLGYGHFSLPKSPGEMGVANFHKTVII